MNLYEVFNEKEIEQINGLENINNVDYSNIEARILESKILENIMSKSSKNGDIAKAREEYSSIIDKLERLV